MRQFCVILIAFSLFSYNITQAENELRLAQAEFDKQTEITRLMMEGLSAIQTNHLRLLKGYIESQTKFYANCHQIMQDLNRYACTCATHREKLTAGGRFFW